jgi:hypothetical protein
MQNRIFDSPPPDPSALPTTDWVALYRLSVKWHIEPLGTLMLDQILGSFESPELSYSAEKLHWAIQLPYHQWCYSAIESLVKGHCPFSLADMTLLGIQISARISSMREKHLKCVHNRQIERFQTQAAMAVQRASLTARPAPPHMAPPQALHVPGAMAPPPAAPAAPVGAPQPPPPGGHPNPAAASVPAMFNRPPPPVTINFAPCAADRDFSEDMKKEITELVQSCMM